MFSTNNNHSKIRFIQRDSMTSHIIFFILPRNTKITKYAGEC